MRLTQSIFDSLVMCGALPDFKTLQVAREMAQRQELGALRSENDTLRMQLVLAEQKSGAAAAPEPEMEPVRTVCQALRRVVATRLNGHPVSRRFLREEVGRLIECDNTSLHGALCVCKGDGLIERGNQYGTWQKPGIMERKTTTR